MHVVASSPFSPVLIPVTEQKPQSFGALEEKIDEICHFYSEHAAFKQLQDFAKKLTDRYPAKIAYSCLHAQALCNFGAFEAAFHLIKQAVFDCDLTQNSFHEFMNAVAMLCRLGHHAKRDVELVLFLDTLQPHFKGRAYLLSHLKEEAVRKRDLARSFENPPVLEKALKLLAKVYKSPELFRSLSRREQNMLSELFVFGVRNQSLIQRLQLQREKGEILVAHSLFLDYLLHTESERYEKNACLVMRLQQCYTLWQLEKRAASDEVLWQKNLLGDPAPCYVTSCLDLDELQHFKTRLGQTIFSSLASDSPFNALHRLLSQAEQIVEAIQKELETEYETGDIAFLNLQKAKSYFGNFDFCSRLRVDAILSLLGPQGHASLVDRSEGSLRVSEVDISQYRNRKISITRLLFYDYYRINVTKLLTEEGKKLVADFFENQERAQKLLQDSFSAACREILSPRLDDAKEEEEGIDDPLFRLLSVAPHTASKQRTKRSQFSSLWNSSRICVLAAFKAFFPYRLPQEQEVKLQGGMICSEFAAKVDYKALKNAEVKIKESMRLAACATMKERIEEVRLFKPLVPNFVDLSLVVSANLVRYAGNALEKRQPPALLQALFQAPEDFWS